MQRRIWCCRHGRGPPAVEGLLAGADAEDLVDERRGLAAQAGGDVGPAVGVAVLRRAPHDVEPRVLLGQGELQVGMVLVVAEQDVVARLVPLDEVVLEGEGLHLGVGDDQVEVGDLGDHGPLVRVPGARGLEVGADAVPQHAGLAHVEDPPLRVLEEVDAGPRGEAVELLARLIRQSIIVSFDTPGEGRIHSFVRMLTARIGEALARPFEALVRSFARFSPDVLTIIGLALNGVACAFFAFSGGKGFRSPLLLQTGGLVALAASVFDMLDGRVARLRGRDTKFGAFLDSTMDRYSDMVLYMGLLILYARVDRTPQMVLVWVAAFGSFMTSYARARAESLIPRCNVGFLERPERIVLIILGALTNRMVAVLWVIAVLSNVTALQRVVYTYVELKRGWSRSEPGGKADVDRRDSRRRRLRGGRRAKRAHGT